MEKLQQASYLQEYNYPQPNGNKKLVDYGIEQEQSDYRAHVGYKAQHIYVFPTSDGVKALNTERQNGRVPKNIYTGGIHTAVGYTIPISAIDNMREILIPIDIYHRNSIDSKMTHEWKGKKATSIVVEMLRLALIPLPINADLINDDDLDLQISGCDILIHSRWKMQVKCDLLAGSKSHGGTGNVFIQTQECNPHKMR